MQGSVRTQKKAWHGDRQWGMLVESNHLMRSEPCTARTVLQPQPRNRPRTPRWAIGRSACSLSRALDRDGNLVDSMGSEKRDMQAATRFFKQAVAVVGHAPERVTTDGHDSSPRALREPPGSEVTHRCNRSLNHRLEQDHRGIKQRSSPKRGFGSVASASRVGRAFDEVRPFFRVRTTRKQKVSLVQQREMFRQ